MPYLPSHNGLLPYWLLLTSGASVFNTVVCYIRPEIGRRPYSGPTASTEVTPLSTRLFGTWTLLSAIVRIHGAYNIRDQGIYAVVLSTYVLALCHFIGEWLVYQTMTFRKGLTASFLVAALTIIWMVAQAAYYTN